MDSNSTLRMDGMRFLPANELEEQLIEAARNPSGHPWFIHELLASELLSLHGDPSLLGPEKKTGRQNSSISIALIGQGRKQYIPVFTSVQRLEAYARRETAYMAMNARTFFSLTRGADLVLNPGAAYGKWFPRREIAEILEGCRTDPIGPYWLPASG